MFYRIGYSTLDKDSGFSWCTGDIRWRVWKNPGFTIIDYSEDTLLVFHDRLADGDKNEIVDFKHRSKYRCTKDNKVIWYNYKRPEGSGIGE